MKVFNLVLAAAMLFSHAAAFAHGEDKPGPHGGEIRMPGAFPTEIILVAQNKIRIYLLDMNWKNPTVKNSNMEVTFHGRHRSEADCRKEKEAFLCSFEEDVNLKHKGKLEVKAVRDNLKGNVAEYKTPLKFKGN